MTYIRKHRVGGMLTNKVGETDVIVKVLAPSGKEYYLNGFYKVIGSPVDGFTLDPDPEFELEYERPELALTVLNYQGEIKKLTAWVNTPKGPQVVLTHLFDEPVAVLIDEIIQVVGPAY